MSDIRASGPWKEQIDFMVYHLYNLTYDEVKIVDSGISITREEYESKQ